MYNFRQLVILLVSVFIALGLGMAVGFSANSDKLLVEQQRKTIDKLEKDFNKLKADNKQRQLELADISEKYHTDMMILDEIYDVLFKGMLETRKVAVIGFDKKALASVADNLEKAGAQVSLLSVQEVISGKVDENNISIHDVLAEEDLALRGFMVSSAMIEQAEALDPPPELFVIIRDDTQIDEYPLIDKFLEFNSPVALVQASSLGVIDVEHREGFIYIENINNAIGKYKLMSFIISQIDRNLGGI